MTEQQPNELTFVEQIEADPRGRAELAVARAQLRLEELLQEVIQEAGDIDVEVLSDQLGVTTERVQRILDGEDPLRFEAFIRYASVLGRRVDIALDDLSIAPPKVVDHFEQVGASPEGVSKIEWHREAADFEVEGIEPPRYTGTTFSVGKVQIHGFYRANTYRLGEQGKGRHAISDVSEINVHV